MIVIFCNKEYSKMSTNSINEYSQNPETPKTKKEYLEINKCSKDFQHIFEKYKATQSRNKVAPNIITLIQDYRTEKLNALTDSEIVKEEIGGEVKKIKDTLFTKHPEKDSHKEVKIKENRNSILITFDKFDKQGKLNLNEYMEKGAKKKRPPVFNPNILYQGGYYKNDIKKKLNQKKRNTIRGMDTEHMNVHDKIDILADVIKYDSKNLKKTYKQSFVNFQNEFDEWKETQEFILPEIKNQEL